MKDILNALKANGVQRNFCIMGGEPLHPNNQEMVLQVIKQVKEKYPNIKIYLWTGYIYEKLDKENFILYNILKNVDVLIDGPFIKEQRDITLEMRGSKNQRIINLKDNNKGEK